MELIDQLGSFFVIRNRFGNHTPVDMRVDVFLPEHFFERGVALMRLDIVNDSAQLILKSNVIDIWSIFVFLDFISHV